MISLIIISNYSYSTTYNYLNSSANNINPGQTVTLTSNLISSGVRTNPSSTHWTGPGLNVTSNPITVSPTVTTTYWCTYNSVSQSITITVIPIPAKPTKPNGPASICHQNSNTYYTNSAANTTSYIWSIYPPTSGIINSLDTTCSITWNKSFSGISKLIVYGQKGAIKGVTSDTLIINQLQTSSSISATSCNNYIAPDGYVYNSSGTIKAIISNSNGCDSTISIALNIVGGSTNSIYLTALNSFSLNGHIYDTTGTYNQTLINSFGCDSIISLHLSIVYSTKGLTKNGEYTSINNQFINQNGKICNTALIGGNGQIYSTPLLTSNGISAITSNSASGGGNITNDGAYTIIERGVCWSTTHNPIITDNKISNGIGIGNFTCNIVGLNNLTTYFIRAYATNSVGTTYGNEIEFVTH